MTREYQTAAAFKQGLEQRLRATSSSGVDHARRRQLVVFDRFLARIALELGDAVTLKGGLAVELAGGWFTERHPRAAARRRPA